MYRWVITAALLFSAAGCFPLEVDVNEKGELLIYRQEGFFLFDPATKKTTQILGHGADTPVFARFAPNGREILAVTRDATRFDEYRFQLVSLAGSKSRTVCKTGTCCYTRFSPDGASLALTCQAWRTIKDPKRPNSTVSEQVLELNIIDVKSGVIKRFTDWTPHVLFRWFHDSKHMLAVVIAGKDEAGKLYHGHLAKVDCASGKFTKIASVASNESVFVDLAPDNKKALVVARAVGPADNMPQVKDDNRGLGTVFEVDIASGAVRKLNLTSEFAIYSPSGKRILLAANKETDGETHSLVVADADGSNAKPLLDFRPPSAAYLSSGGEALALPGWCNERTIFFFHSQAVYGVNRQAPWLKTVSLDDLSVSVLQPYVDVGVVEAEAATRNNRRAPAGDSRRLVFPSGNSN